MRSTIISKGVNLYPLVISLKLLLFSSLIPTATTVALEIEKHAQKFRVRSKFDIFQLIRLVFQESPSRRLKIFDKKHDRNFQSCFRRYPPELESEMIVELWYSDILINCRVLCAVP